MESRNCRHCIDSEDEHFLLDDENLLNNCSICKNNRQMWNNGAVLAVENHIETLEDSPLLIQNCYENQDDRYHCHRSNCLIENEDNKAWKKLLIASILCFLFMVTELIGGFLSGSLAVMTDAAHLFSDFVGFLISLLSIWLARRTATKTMTFGFHRTEVLGALFSVLSVWLLASVFAVLAVNRLWKKDYEIDADTMMLVASLGLGVNIIMGTILYGFCHNHNHGLNFQENNINVRAAAVHVLGDLLQSFGVLVAAIIIKIFPNAKLADPICSLVFALFVICTTPQIAWDSIWMLLEGAPLSSLNYDEIVLEFQQICEVQHVHNLHIWTLSPGKDALIVHLCVDKYCDKNIVLEKATLLVQSKLSIINSTIQIENFNQDINNSCRQCQLPTV